MVTKAHIINHTHWDREWFASYLYTREWIPKLISEVEKLSNLDPTYRFYLDGQTLILDDLQEFNPKSHRKARKLIASGNLLVGPYFAQLDWKLPSGESLIRNLEIGTKAAKENGGDTKFSGWLVDIFGHISQSPQIHNLFGINHVFLWRGIPKLIPFFNWEGANNSTTFAVNLFAGGYRNLYGIVKHPDSALKRITKEIKKLTPYYASGVIPLFDGYDLDTLPENPKAFFKEKKVSIPNTEILTSSPYNFYSIVKKNKKTLPLLKGELLSGKYAAIFSGTLSARTYLKILNSDTEKLLFRYLEPLLSMQKKKLDKVIVKELLKNQIHDCICGVSIDQIHDRMEFSYKSIIKKSEKDLEDNLVRISSNLKNGTYAYTPSAYKNKYLVTTPSHSYSIESNGLGIYPANEKEPVTKLRKQTKKFVWTNNHYKAVLNNGKISVGDMNLGEMVIRKEFGDTYSDERRGRNLKVRKIGKMYLVSVSASHATLSFDLFFRDSMRKIKAKVDVTFDTTPLIKWKIELDTKGTNYALKLLFKTGKETDSIFAGMQYDTVYRNLDDTDLLSKRLAKPLKTLLLGQREINRINSFPFHEYFGITQKTKSYSVFAKGIHAYSAKENGDLSILLRRSICWLTKPVALRDRVGDAGPYFYVPGAKCQRTVLHEVAFGVVKASPESKDFQLLNDTFQNPPILFEVSNSNGKDNKIEVTSLTTPISSLRYHQNRIKVRTHNPCNKVVSTYYKLNPKEIKEIEIKYLHKNPIREGSKISLLCYPCFNRVAFDNSKAGKRNIKKLLDMITVLRNSLSQIEKEINKSGKTISLSQRYYITKRELKEAELSIYLNRIRDSFKDKQAKKYIDSYDKELARLNKELNELRMKRRMYDYIAES